MPNTQFSMLHLPFMKESDLFAANRKSNILQCKLFETEAPIKQLERDLQAALQTLQQTRQELV